MNVKKLKAEYYDAAKLKKIILEDKNLDILLYLAKYNPGVTLKDIREKFGSHSVKELKNLKEFELIDIEENSVWLTQQGIFQVDGLLSIVV